MPDVADDELNVPPPEPLHFNIDEPELLDDDMVEILLLEEARPHSSDLTPPLSVACPGENRYLCFIC